MSDVEPTPLRGFIDARCNCHRCEARTGNTYRMVGRCSNCRAGDFLMLYRAGDPAMPRDCPRCGNYDAVSVYRAATDDEIPVAAGA